MPGDNNSTGPTTPPPTIQDLNGKRAILTTMVNGSSVLDGDGSNVLIWERHGGNNQIWEFTLEPSTNAYTIRNVGWNSYLTENSQRNVILNNQLASATKWRVNPVSGNGYEIQSVTSNQYLDLPSSNTQSGTRMLTWPKNNGNNQRWLIEVTNSPTSPPGPTTPPPSQTLQPPTNLRETGKTADSISIAWNPPTSMTNVVGYRIYRNNTSWKTVGTNVTNYLDSGLSPNTLYRYKIASYDLANNEALSNEISVTTNQGGTIPPPSSGSIAYTFNNDKMRIINTSATPINGWTLDFNYTGTIWSMSGAVSWDSVIKNGHATAKNASHTANIPPNGGQTSDIFISGSGVNISNVMVNGITAIRI
jgi:hypothetical protein